MDKSPLCYIFTVDLTGMADRLNEPIVYFTYFWMTICKKNSGFFLDDGGAPILVIETCSKYNDI